MAKVLIIEDDAKIADLVKGGLRQKDYEVEVASTGLGGLEAVESKSPDLVVLDLILPDMDGIEVCRELRSNSDIGIIILTARHMIGDRVLGLEAGADDYLSKPFAFEELVARIRSVLRRKKAGVEGVIHVGDLEIDITRRKVRRGERLVELTTREYDLLKLLAENVGRPLHREFILRRIWGDDFESDWDPVKSYVGFLRQKLNSCGEADLIKALRGFGYVLEETS